MKKSKLTLRCLCEAAIMIALAQILGYLKLYELPQGGSMAVSMRPSVSRTALTCALKAAPRCSTTNWAKRRM